MHEDQHSQPLTHDPQEPRFRHLRSLQTSSGRTRPGLYLIEGIRHVARAVEERAPIESIFVAPNVLSNPFRQKLARRLRQSGTPCLRLAPNLYGDLTLAAEPQGLGAVIRQQWTPLAAVRPRPSCLFLGVESIDSPGNLGTIIRTAEATGVAAIVTLGSGADPYEPAAIRASMGSLFSQKLVRCSTIEFARWARASGVAIVGSSPKGLLDYRRFQCRWPAMLLIGSEKHGLSDQLFEACDFTVRIPMLGRGDSINAAVAAGVLLYELFDQRRADVPVGLPIRKRAVD
jgi:TrmH family RNA methyltransferase